MRISGPSVLFICILSMSCSEPLPDTLLDTLPDTQEEPSEPPPWEDTEMNFSAVGPDGNEYYWNEGPMVIKEGESITFTNRSENTTNGFVWSFSAFDLSASTVENEDTVTITYAFEGIYSVFLINREKLLLDDEELDRVRAVDPDGIDIFPTSLEVGSVEFVMVEKE